MLKVENVTLKFGGLVALSNVNLEIKRNQITALIGPNGAGKTTLFNCISGVYTPDEGAIIFDNQHIEGKKGYMINALGIARTYQLINLFWKMSVIENVLVGMHTHLKSGYFSSLIRTRFQRKEEKEAIDRAYEILKFVDLQKKAFDVAGSLSYGEQRLLEIARALASSPKLLLLDEPAAGMNSAEKEELDVLLNRILEKGITILLIEHDMKLVMNVADYIFVLNEGRLLAEGTPIEIQNNEDVIRAYLGGE